MSQGFGVKALPSSPLLKEGPDARSAPISPSRRIPKIDYSRVDPKLIEGAQKMESLFLDHLMQAMRKTVPENALGLDSHATKIYQSMMDSEMAKTAAKTGGVGIADQIIAYLHENRYNLNQGPTRKVRPDVINEKSNEVKHEGQSGDQ